MKVQLSYKILLLLLCSLLSSTTLLADKYDVEKIKTIEKEFVVNSDALVHIDNKFGKVHIDTWDQNLVKVLIEISVLEKDEERATERINNIEVEIHESTSEVAFKTLIEENDKWYKNMNWNSGGDKHHKIQINYTIQMPHTANLKLSNKYGNAYVGNLEGTANISIKYGNLKAENLNGSEGVLELGYSNADIEAFRNVVAEIKYSDVEITKSENMLLNCKYSDVEIEQVDFLDSEFKYGKLELESVISLEGEFKYSGVEIGELLNDLDLEISYGPNFQIDYIPAAFESIDIEANFTSVVLRFDEASSFELDAEASYGDIRIARSFDADVDVNQNAIGTSKDIKAIIGTHSDKHEVDVDISYGNLSIEQN